MQVEVVPRAYAVHVKPAVVWGPKITPREEAVKAILKSSMEFHHNRSLCLQRYAAMSDAELNREAQATEASLQRLLREMTARRDSVKAPRILVDMVNQ